MGDKIWNFLKEFSWPFGLCAGVYALLSRFIPLEAQANLNLLLAGYVFFLALTICLSGYLLRRPPMSDHPDIRVTQSRDRGQLLIVKKTPALGVNMGALVYLKDGAYERLIAVGSISHVQTDGSPQLALQYVAGAEVELIQKISENTREALDSLIVRPAVRFDDTVLGIGS